MTSARFRDLPALLLGGVGILLLLLVLSVDAICRPWYRRRRE